MTFRKIYGEHERHFTHSFHCHCRLVVYNNEDDDDGSSDDDDGETVVYINIIDVNEDGDIGSRNTNNKK